MKVRFERRPNLFADHQRHICRCICGLGAQPGAGKLATWYFCVVATGAIWCIFFGRVMTEHKSNADLVDDRRGSIVFEMQKLNHGPETEAADHKKVAIARCCYN